jgi:hypothetical protein
MAKPLFTDGGALDAAYRNIRDARNGPLYSARVHCEYFWTFFERHADNEFLREVRNNFHARYWEMYFTTTLILSGYEVNCPKPGPDVGIINGGKRIWFECVSPTAGDPNKPDYIAPPKTNGEAYDIPNERIILRYLNSISEKYDRQYANWITKGIISTDDAFVIALNPRAVPLDFPDIDPPRILQAAYTVGPLYVTIDRGTGEIIGTGYHFRNKIKKGSSKNGNDAEKSEQTSVTTGVFQDRKHDGLSCLLCSRLDAANRRGELGADFQIAPNPHATVPLPDGLRLRGTYYDVKIVEDGYQVTPVVRK